VKLVLVWKSWKDPMGYVPQTFRTYISQGSPIARVLFPLDRTPISPTPLLFVSKITPMTQSLSQQTRHHHTTFPHFASSRSMITTSHDISSSYDTCPMPFHQFTTPSPLPHCAIGSGPSATARLRNSTETAVLQEVPKRGRPIPNRQETLEGF
jgi:hypothetical protein